MDLNCSLKFGLSQDAIKTCRRDWSLAHDVKLLKFLENFSENLISRTGEALKALEKFEQDLFSLSLNIQTVSHRFQSLANKQFIEHCVFEDDLSTYTKPGKNTAGVTDGSSNDMLNKALTSCLSSFTVKHNYGDGYSKNLSNALYETRPLPLHIGSEGFTDFYSQLFLNDEKNSKPMQSSEITSRENISDQQSIPDSLSLHSASSNVVDEDRNFYCVNDLNHEVDHSTPSISSMSSDLGVNNKDISAVSNKKRTSNEWLSQDNYGVRSNGYEVTPPNNQSLFDDDDEVDSEDLFSFAKVNPFAETSVEPLKSGIIPSKESADTLSSSDWDESNSKIGEGTLSCDDKVIDSHEYKTPGIRVNLPSSEIVNHNLETNKNLLKESLPVSKKDMDDDLPSSDRIYKKTSSASMNESLNHSIKDTFSSNIKPYSSKDDKFSLFSDEDPSDDEILFNSPKNKNRKEKFKKLLEEKISSAGLPKMDNKFKGLSNPCNQINTAIAETKHKNDTFETKTGCHEDNSLLPSYNTSTLNSLAKNRPRIKNKRRPPSRKHLKGFHSVNDSYYSEDKGKLSVGDDLSFNECAKVVSILSPSTEEEDLFIVPATSIAHEVSCSNLFLASSLLSPGSSLDHIDECPIEQKTKNSSVSTPGKTNDSNTSNKNSPVSSIKTLPKIESNISVDSSFKNNYSSSKFFWNNESSLFNDSEEDDDLFSSTSSKKLSKKIITKSNCSAKEETSLKKDKSCVVDNDFFDDLFSQNSDDDSLFKVKEKSLMQAKPSANHVRKEGNNNHPSYGNNLTSNADFKDPLSSFNEN